MQHSSACLTPSPPSSPSLVPVDSSPLSSPSLHALCTPPGSPSIKDPFAGSSRSNRRPPLYELHTSKRRPGVTDCDNAEVSPVDLLMRANVASAAENSILDATPTRLDRAIDLFSGSAKREWRPPTHERRPERVYSDAVPTNVSCTHVPQRAAQRINSPTPTHRTEPVSSDDVDDFYLTDDEYEIARSPGKPKTMEEIEHDMWDDAITRAIEQGNGVIDLSTMKLVRGIITHIPPSIADLESFTVLSPPHTASSAPASPTLSPTLVPAASLPPSSALLSSRPFTRATTLAAPAFGDTFFRSKDGERLRGTPAARAASLQALTMQPTGQLHRREISIYLANNAVSRLPSELFRVRALTVLSLRCNKLTFIPPQISQLTALKELNLAQNRLQWLPAEMLQMNLEKLTVSSNPWIPPPVPPQGRSFSPSHGTPDQRPVSETVRLFSVPPLTEICLRVLLAPYNPKSPRPQPTASSSRPFDADTPVSKHLTVLEASYALPLTEDLLISPAVLTTLRACVPAAVARPAEESLPPKVRRGDVRKDVHSGSGSDAPSDKSTNSSAQRHGHEDDDVFAPRVWPARPPTLAGNDNDDVGIGVCPCTVHRAPDGSFVDGRVPVFVHHVEERWSWEEVVAGVKVGAEGVGGVGVPVRWRGCLRGCLAFLDPPCPPAQRSGPGQGEGMAIAHGSFQEGALNLDVDMNVEGDEDVQSMSFEGGLVDLEDFEEQF